MAFLKQLFSPSQASQYAHAAYLAVVVQSRNPVFYSGWNVPDTVDGRFDIIVLHLFLVLAVCEGDKDFSQVLTELFFADMDRSLREMGVGDTGIGRRVQAMAQAFYGRLKAYEESVGKEGALEDAMRRNVWREQPAPDASVNALADYTRRNYQSLRTQPLDAVLHGHIEFLR
jgi:cytochrome b pre-mRNA-processing protein 3